MAAATPPPVAFSTLCNFAISDLRHTLQPLPDLSKGRAGFLATVAQHQVDIYDARAVPGLSLGTSGFQLVTATTAVADYADDAAVCDKLYGECEDIIRSATGCQEVITIGHLRRNGGDGSGKFDGVYAQAVHADFSPYYEVSAPAKLLAGVEGKRWCVYNLWRSTTEHDVEMMPLAVADLRTVERDDLVLAEAFTPGDGGHEPPRKTIYQRLVHNPAQHFYVFPRMSPTETLVFKQYDTHAEPHCRQCFHSAVVDPSSLETARRRESIEVRVIAVFGDDPGHSAGRASRIGEIPSAGSEVWRALPGGPPVAPPETSSKL